jgi:hypothetical protein
LVDKVLQESPQKQKEVKKDKSKWILLVLLLLLLIGCIFYSILNLNSFDITQGDEHQISDEPWDSSDNNLFKEENPSEQKEDVETEDELSIFTGESIGAQLPANWTIVEYYDGEGTTGISQEYEGFTGLTGLKIFKNEAEIFYLQAIYGIGFPGCPSYAKFEDENPSYYEQMLENNEITDVEIEVTDYTESEYVEFEWLGTTFRRVNKYYNYDTVSGNEYFEPSCVPTILTLEGLEYYPPDGPSAKSYDYGPTENASEEDLLIVDEILESMILAN